MNALYYLLVTLHVLAALLWLGGMFFLALVGAPTLRRVEPPVLRRDLFRQLGHRYRPVGWSAIAVLVVTGTLLLEMRGILTPEVLGSAEFWASSWGSALALKLGLVGMMLAIQGFHDFVHGPRAGRLEPGSEAARRVRRPTLILARLNTVAGIVLVYAAVRLARGG